ncbi:hypothetical protein JCM10908_001929 [Rhodotorula pacifica]|uniref:ATP-binding mismatch repair protein n=1 Tax=Rhodotorula pacifica TaxID=1495444 RepID=UPI00317169CF
MSIQAIDRTSVHRLTSGQVVIDLQAAVKELVENALDAGATIVSVKFREHGVDEIEVEDNGRGIDKEDWPGLALKHHTSKLTTFDDLASVSTLGFRGEALSSLCGVAILSMTTSTSPSLPLGTALSFTHAGECIVGGKVSRSRGTTVKVERLFEKLPVRRKEWIKNAKREMGKALDMVQAYALIKTGVRFEVRNVLKGKSQVHLQTPISTTLRANVSNIFGPKTLLSILDLDLTLEVPTEKTVIKRLEGSTESSTTVRIKGLISKPSAPHGRPAGNRQFYYINGRPFAPAKVAKAVNEAYKSFNANQFPIVVADFQLAPDAYDVNVSPDKRTIFLHSEGNLIACLKEALTRFFEPEKGTFAMQAIGPARGAGGSKPASPTLQLKEEEEVREENGGEDMEPPRKKRRDEDGSPIATPASTPGPSRTTPFSSSSRTASRSSSIVVEITNPMPPLADEEVFLPEPPACFYEEEEDEARPAVDHETSGHEDTAQVGRNVANKDEEPPLFRRASPTPRPPSDMRPSPILRDSPPSTTASANRTIVTSPAPRLAQSKLTFASESGASGSADGKGKRRAATSTSQETSTGRMQGLLKQFLNGAPRSQAKEAEVGVDELDDIDGASRAASVESVTAWSHSTRRSRVVPSSSPDPLDHHAQAEEVEPADDEADRLADDQLAEQPEDVVMLVEDSFVRAPSSTSAQPAPAPTSAAEDVDSDELEIVAASCACVHGSQESDGELEVVTPPPAPVADVAPDPAALPFGAAPSEVAGTIVAADAILEVDLANLDRLWTAPSSSREIPSVRSTELSAAADNDTLAGAGIDERDEAAEATLSRVVSKADFDAMQVVGQFNLGFIIARRRVEVPDGRADGGELHDDLFIVDQHASDEKYNFERLQAETVIQSQRLLAPRILSLPSADEITAMEHIDILRLNGFDVDVDESAGVGERVKLTAQPVSKDTVFDIADLEELVELIANSGGAEVVRPTKARRMFASRACRKSVMIGKALNNAQMTTILRHMGGMEQPWACPHGRPTMRWVR